MEYKPEFKEGQILVRYKIEVDSGFAETLGKFLGYEISEDKYLFGGVFIYETKKGKEEEAMKKFKSYKEFVDWTARRDIKFEQRIESLDEVIELLRDLSDNVEIPDKKYNKKLNDISNYIQSLKSK